MKIKNWKIFVLTISLMLFFCFVFISAVFSQNWYPLPPYNFLWPLWSPALSPADPITGLPTPLVSELTSSTELSAQPVLAWNPNLSYPYILFNSPDGLVYYDPLYGLDAWPPSYSLDPMTGLPAPLSLPVGFCQLPPTYSFWIQQHLPIACLAYLIEYPNVALTSLLTPADILGY